jgi:hypothetical protein
VVTGILPAVLILAFAAGDHLLWERRSRPWHDGTVILLLLPAILSAVWIAVGGLVTGVERSDEARLLLEVGPGVALTGLLCTLISYHGRHHPSDDLRKRTVPPVAVVVGFIDCINQRDVPGLGRLMTSDHRLEVYDEPAVVGRSANVRAWQGYVGSFPNYLIHPHRFAENGGTVAVLGHTTGSHLDLPDAEESRLTLIWVAEVVDGGVRSWRLIDDTPDNRRGLGLGTNP